MTETDCLVVGAGTLSRHLHAVWQPRSMLGIRRRQQDMPFPLICGDTSAAGFWRQSTLPQEVSRILITATPGLRRGGSGNGLLAMCQHLRGLYPQARVVYTGSTAVYGNGSVCDESTPPSREGRSPALQAIEQAVLSWDRGLVLRVGAIVGPSRFPKRLLARADDNTLSISGDPERPFPFIHEADLVAVLHAALLDEQLRGIINCVAPIELSYAAYYQGYLPPGEVTIVGDGNPMPSRKIVARPLWDHFPQHSWRLPWED